MCSFSASSYLDYVLYIKSAPTEIVSSFTHSSYFLELLSGLAQICVGSNTIQQSEKYKISRSNAEGDSDDSDESTSDTFDDATSPEFLKKKLEFMFRIYDIDR